MREVYYYYRGGVIQAIRKGDYKLHVRCVRRPAFALDVISEEELNTLPWLYNIGEDPCEKYNIAGGHPEIVAELLQLIEDRERDVVPVESIFDRL